MFNTFKCYCYCLFCEIKQLTFISGGESAQLECKVQGSPLPKVLWLKNGRPLKASDGCKVIVEEDGTNILVFPNANEDDVGIYTARAMNVNGSIMCSAEFTLVDGKFTIQEVNERKASNCFNIT